MKNKVSPKIMSGFMELLPAEQIVFDKMKQIIEQTYQTYGFVSLDTPVMELSEVLLAKAGGETEKQIYRFQKGDADISLRFDLTVPLARYVAAHQNDLAFPFRRCQISKSYRGERPQRGRLREFYQADIDIIGSEKLSVLADAELPSIIYQTLKNLGLDRFMIRLNNRKVLKGFYEALGLADKQVDILRLIDKIDKIGVQNVMEGLKDLGLDEKACAQIKGLIEIQGSSNEVICALKELGVQNDLYIQGVDELEKVAQAMINLGTPESHFKIDLTIARGLDYYTGTVYETNVIGHEEWGSICSGGRYENLAENYTDRKYPGVGMSIGLSRLFDFLRGANMLRIGAVTPADVLIVPMANDTRYALKVATMLRNAGVKTEVYFADTKFKNKMTYANKIKVPYVLILGEDEEKNTAVSLKNMVTGDQQTVVLGDLIPVMEEAVLARPPEKPVFQKA